MKPSHRLIRFVIVAVLVSPTAAQAHGLIGKRFLPSTLVIEDPAVTDELTFPSVVHIKRPARGDEPATRETEISGEVTKRITPRLGVSLEGELVHLDPDRAPSLTGFGNLEVGLKYEVWRSVEREAIVSVGVGWEVGGTGRKATEAESFDVVKAAVLYGKGFGDLPEALAFAKPLALTGVLGLDHPTQARTRTVRLEADEAEVEVESHADVLRWGFALQYSVPYLQSFVRDVGLPAPFNRIVPLVELDFATPVNRESAGRTTGTINPGLIWAGKFFQVGVEAMIPVNERTGRNVGVRAMLHFFLDDLFPTSLGRPLFGR